MVEFLSLSGDAITLHLPDIARLRITVFREFPYLYDGSLDYEMEYLQAYVNSPRSLIVLIRENGRAIGATTALPLLEADSAFQEPFLMHNIPVAQVYYFGESVLLPSHRGKKYGHRFFDERECRAEALGYPITAFCAVVRDEQHPLRPSDYVPHDKFWKKRGYSMASGFTCTYPWKDIDQPTQTDKIMQFWLRDKR